MSTGLYQGTPIRLNAGSLAFHPSNDSFEDKCQTISLLLFDDHLTNVEFDLQARNEVNIFNICRAETYADDRPTSHADAGMKLVFYRFRSKKVQSRSDLTSEVLTTRFLGEKYHLPIPKVYAYCDNGTFLGESFIVMGRPEGVPLLAVWHLWSRLPVQQERFVKSLAAFVFKLSNVPAARIGAPIWSPTGELSVGPNAGKITAVLNWEGTNYLPMWMLAKRPSKMLGAKFADWEDTQPSQL
ncbi:hypothetical protein CALVIDRAFT_557828 [Calocera viscosa TUFC12733]|uniref:Aminoglycoside phosphotransferase domain-containing protein n=1 Tax=Calocera viscosa (strain TUFC12733) TaxID=1330018 RepID=A0A167HUZ8_CALVF|nr:hypothetical protein CALVIDRAFT_557828 [Calocera viscosa TUFC12733]